MRRNVRQERRQERRNRRQDRRDNRGTGAKVAIGVAGAAAVGAAVHHHRKEGSRPRSGSHSSSSSSSSDDSNAPETYAMREKILAFGNDFQIERMSRRRGRGKPAFYVDNKIVRVRETFNLRASRGGPVLYQIQERKARVRDSMAIEDARGHKIAEIKKRAVGVVRDNFVVKIRGETNWQVHGSVLEHDFTVKEGGTTIARVHKKWIAPIKDCYFIDVEDADDVALALMVVIGLEEMS